MRIFLILCSCILLAAPAFSAPVIRQKNFAKRNYCNVYDLLKLNRYQVGVRQKELLASTKYRKLAFVQKQRRFTCNNQRVELCYPLIYDSGQQWLSVLDWQKTLRSEVVW